MSYARLLGDQPLLICGAAARMRKGEAGFEGAFDRAFQEITRRLGESALGWKDVKEMASFHSRVLLQLPSFFDVFRLHADPATLRWHTIEHGSLGLDVIAEIRVIAALGDLAANLPLELRGRNLGPVDSPRDILGPSAT